MLQLGATNTLRLWMTCGFDYLIVHVTTIIIIIPFGKICKRLVHNEICKNVKGF